MLRVQKPMRIVLMKDLRMMNRNNISLSTVGDFSGFRKVTTSENPSFKCKDNLLLDFESVDGSAVVMSVTVEQFNDTDIADMEVAMKAIF